MAQNMYRVGDYVYFETMPSAPYQIRRIEELNKTPTGAVEAKVTSFFRRRDLPNSLLKIADQAERQSQILSKPRKILLATNKESCTVINTSSAITNTNGEAETAPKENGIPADPNIKSRNNSVEPHEDANKADEDKDTANDDDHKPKCYGFAGLPSGAEKLDTEELHELRQRELFLSRIVELLPATGIRGKCMVAILNDVETCDMYLGQEDSFFYSLVYDPANQTLLADKGRIEIGIRHQADIPEIIDLKKTQNDEEKADQIEEKMEIEQPQEEGKEANIAKEEKEEEQPATSASELPKGNELTPNKKLLESGGVQLTDRERCVYHPNHQLQDLEIDQFLLVARAIGTFSRALDTSSSTKLPTLHQTAAAASRDITLLHAMALMHQANYDFGKATKFLVPPADTQHYPLEADKVTSHNTSNLGGPILCRDQLEEFSASESTLFEDGIEKYGKDFNDIRLDYLPWKSMRDIVEYYYMWKTTSRYADLQKAKRAEKDNKLKQVYIPNYNKPNSNLVSSKSSGMQCESCHLSEAPFWYAWGPSQEFRLCDKCWMVWKKRGGLKNPHELETFDLDGANDGRGGNSGNRRNGLPIGSANSDRQTAGQILIGQKGRVAFFLNSPLETRVARRLAPRQVFNVRKAARAPFQEFDLKGIQDYYFSRPIGDVLNTARQVTKRGSLSPWSMDHLTKMHKKRGQSKPLAAVAEQNGGGKKIG